MQSSQPQRHSKAKSRECATAPHGLLSGNLDGPKSHNSIGQHGPLSLSDDAEEPQLRDVGPLSNDMHQLSIDQVVLEEAPLPASMEKKKSARSNGATILSSTMVKQRGDQVKSLQKSVTISAANDDAIGKLVGVKSAKHKASGINSLEQTLSASGKEITEVPENEEPLRRAGQAWKKSTPTKTLASHHLSQGRPSTSKYLTQHQMSAALAATMGGAGANEAKGKPQAPPLTIKPKTKKSMGGTQGGSLSVVKKLKQGEGSARGNPILTQQPQGESPIRQTKARVQSKTRKESKPRQVNQKRELSNHVRNNFGTNVTSSLIFVTGNHSSKILPNQHKLAGSSIERITDPLMPNESRSSILNERQAHKIASKLSHQPDAAGST